MDYIPGMTPAETPLALLLACHDNIRRFAGGIVTLEALPIDDPRIPDAAARIAHYLREGLPLHVRDEEDSILPRLPARIGALARMVEQHSEHVPLLDTMLPRLDAAARGPARLTGGAALLAAFEAHLQLEEAEIFPFLDELPDPMEVVREIRARRAAPGSPASG